MVERFEYYSYSSEVPSLLCSMTTLVTPTEWARSEGFPPQYAHKLIKSGIVERKNGKVDPEQASAAIAAIANPTKDRQRKGKAKEPVSLSQQLLEHRTKKEKETARLAELDRKEREGDLVSRREVEAAVFNRAREESEAWLNWPARFSAQIASELNLEQSLIASVLDRYVRAHLEE